MSEFSILNNITVHDKGQLFTRLPEIYQIEACSACDLQCPMCLRTTHMDRHPSLVKMELLELMHKRGDFNGSYYVELQMAGEPTMHPKLDKIIDFLHKEVGVMVGLSTHGLHLDDGPIGFEKIHTLLQLDALTISVDSMDQETYHKMRYPAHLEDLLSSLHQLFLVMYQRECAYEKHELNFPSIELQLIKTDMFKGSGDVRELYEVMKGKGWDNYASIRTTGDCFSEMQERADAGSNARNTDLCTNPWSSVSVAANGDVVSCCFIFDPKKDEVNYLGNLYENSLEEIWNGRRVEELRRQHKENQLTGQCRKCYLKSPVQIHQGIVSRLVRNRRK